jgi:hypothetical protein
LYRNFHANQGGFDVLAFQRVATDLLEPRVRKSKRSRRSRQRANVVPSRKRLTCGLQPDALASANYQYTHSPNPDLVQSASQTLPSRFTFQEPDWIVVIANDSRPQGPPDHNRDSSDSENAVGHFPQP